MKYSFTQDEIDVAKVFTKDHPEMTFCGKVNNKLIFKNTQTEQWFIVPDNDYTRGFHFSCLSVAFKINIYF